MLRAGLPLKDDKVVGPTTILDFLSIILDTAAMELHLPEDKVSQLEALSGQPNELIITGISSLSLANWHTLAILSEQAESSCVD